MRFLIALQLLTIIPVRIKRRLGNRDFAGSMPFFPLIGVLIGLVLAGMQLCLSRALPAQVTGVVLVMALTLLTGGLHIDGLTDTADALFSGKDRRGKLRIMRDSNVGALGAATLVLFLILKVSLLVALPGAVIVPALVLMPMAGRSGLLLPAATYRYARSEKGTGQAFIGTPSGLGVAVAVICSGALAATLLSWSGLIAFALALVVALSLGKYIAAKVGGMTGDTLGAITEGAEVMFLVVVCASAAF